MDAFDAMMVVLRFNEKINQRDLDGLVELMTLNHTFIDKEGEVDEGREVMREGWRNFFKRWPDYRNVFTRVKAGDDLVVMMGYATCSYPPLDGPFLWSAKIREGRISEWRVYEDNQDNRRILGLSP